MTQIATVDKRATTTMTTQRTRNQRFKFGYWYPQREVSRHNPIRNYELHHAPDTLDLKLITTRWMTYVVVAMLAIWVLALIISLSTFTTSRYSDLPDGWYAVWTNITWAFLAITFADRFIYDFICLISGINRISKEVNGGNWELISLTDVNVDHIVQAKHAFAQTRPWRAMSIVMGLRLGIVLVAIAHGLLGLIITRDEYNLGTMLDDVFDAIVDNPVTILITILVFFTSLLAIYFYVIEPRWRLRVITAASLSVSSRIRSTTMGLLYGLGTLIAFWISQIFVFGVVSFTFSFVYPIFIEWGDVVDYNEGYALGVSFLLLFSVTFTAFIGYITYHDMVDYWLSNASRRLIALHGGSRPRRYRPTRAFMTVFGLVIGIWAFFAFWSMFFDANHAGDYYYGSTYAFGFVVNDVYALGLGIILMGLFLALGLQVVLDFITLLSMKQHNRYVQYTTGRTRLAREINIVMALRLSVICTLLLHFILGLKMGDQLTVVSVAYGFVIAGMMFIFALFEMQWSVTTLRQIGHVIETRFSSRFVQILLIYAVVFLRWVLYGVIFLGVAYILAQLPFLRIATDERHIRILAFMFPTVAFTGGMIFMAHILIRAGVRRLRS